MEKPCCTQPGHICIYTYRLGTDFKLLQGNVNSKRHCHNTKWTTAKAGHAQQAAAERQKKDPADRDFVAQRGSRSSTSGRQTATPARLLD